MPPILMGLDVWYSVCFFSFVLFFFQICWWILFSWICCIKKKGSFSVFLQAVVAQICGSVEGGVTLVCVPAGNFFRLVVFRTFFASPLASRSQILLSASALRFAQQTATKDVGSRDLCFRTVRMYLLGSS